MEPRDWPRAHAWGRLVRDQRCWHGSTAPAGACERDGVSHSHDLSWWARKLLEPARPDTTPLSFEGPRTIVFVLHPARSLSIHHRPSPFSPRGRSLSTPAGRPNSNGRESPRPAGCPRPARRSRSAQGQPLGAIPGGTQFAILASTSAVSVSLAGTRQGGPAIRPKGLEIL